MTPILEAIVKLVIEQLDLLLILAIVVLIQGLKKAMPKTPKKAWLVVNIIAGAASSWLVGPSDSARDFARQWLIYSAGAEFAYQSWRTVTDVLKSRLKRG